MKNQLYFKIALFAVVFAAGVWGFHTMLFRHLPGIFNEAVEDMSFGWYVPLFSLYVLWTERRQLVESLGDSSWLGALCVLPAIFVGFLGVRGVQVRLAILSMVALLIMVPWAFFGWRTAKRMMFPSLFLLFCIPLATFLDIITVHLRLLATGTAFGILKGFGLDIIRTGTMLAAADGSFSIDVAEPCSGLRSIFALMALTAGYAYFNQPNWLCRGILFSLSIPLAVAGNVMRIMTISLVGVTCSADFASGFYHDYSGYVVFIVAIALMVACGEAITKVRELLVVKTGRAS